ncbi:DUF4333 domain-containing protein [Nocardioides soli]|uniref:DUF4333 domain-containing protein n=1 Tax=Nocardioides soli TaxID=1036020 RepID=A0A7W4YZD3_9ACTN|nr:DUF4333 domain-containing protein [Nocardioides soli]MBB3041044.1 hypothetical protein [Nocardioides soli]
MSESASSTPAASHGSDVSNHPAYLAYVWTIALLPLVWLPLGYWVPALAAQEWAMIAYWVIAVVLAILDSQQLKKGGVNVSPGAALLIPLYLILRTVRARSTPAVPILWFASFGAAVIGQLTFAASYQFDGEWIEPDIAEWATNQGAGEVDVDCPTKWVHADEEVRCTVTDGAGNTASVIATLGDDGYYSWSWR